MLNFHQKAIKYMNLGVDIVIIIYYKGTVKSTTRAKLDVCSNERGSVVDTFILFICVTRIQILTCHVTA